MLLCSEIPDAVGWRNWVVFNLSTNLATNNAKYLNNLTPFLAAFLERSHLSKCSVVDKHRYHVFMLRFYIINHNPTFILFIIMYYDVVLKKIGLNFSIRIWYLHYLTVRHFVVSLIEYYSKYNYIEPYT